MDFNQAFDRTLKNFGISAKWLAEQSGVAAPTISDFRRGKKSIQTDSLGKLLGALPTEAKLNFFSLLLGQGIGAENLVAAMDNDELSAVVMAVAHKLKGGLAEASACGDSQSLSKNTDPKGVCEELIAS